MDNDKKIEPLTGQSITVSLGGKSYQIRRASLYDIGLMNKFRREKIDKKDDANVELESIFFLLCELMKTWTPDMTPDKLAQSIPFENYKDVVDAMEKAGFKLPQREKEKVNMPTGV